jgi:hypothetical protein
VPASPSRMPPLPEGLTFKISFYLLIGEGRRHGALLSFFCLV